MIYEIATLINIVFGIGKYQLKNHTQMESSLCIFLRLNFDKYC